MVEITLKVPEQMAQTVEELVRWMPEVEYCQSMEAEDANDMYDLCFKAAILSLMENYVIRYPRDYAWIMMGMQQDMENDFQSFSSTRGFIAYLQILGIRGPSNTALFNAIRLVDGVYPEWEFLDEPDVNEKRRRKEVYQLFLVAFKKAKRKLGEQKGKQRR